MKSFAAFLCLLAIPSAQAGGLRRMRNVEPEEQQPVIDQQSENEFVKEQVSNLYLGLAQEVQGQARDRVLNQRRRKEGQRKMIGFDNMNMMGHREKLFERWGDNVGGAAGAGSNKDENDNPNPFIPVAPIEDEEEEKEEPIMSMSMSMPTLSETHFTFSHTAQESDMSMSMSMSM